MNTRQLQFHKQETKYCLENRNKNTIYNNLNKKINKKYKLGEETINEIDTRYNRFTNKKRHSS